MALDDKCPHWRVWRLGVSIVTPVNAFLGGNMDKIFEQLDGLLDRYEELQELMSDPEVISDTKRYLALSKEEGGMRDVVAAYKKYKQVLSDIKESEEVLRESKDDDMEALAKEDLEDLQKQKADLEDQIKVLMLPKDPNDDKNIIMEIRGAAGGDEASLFAGDLLNMYMHYAERQGWKTEIIDATPTEVGGYKEVVVMITGDNVYSKLKYENGAHRVQRVPVTESAGRVHTSTATVGVMPEYDEVDLKIDPKDIRTDVYRSSGAGGQHVNKTSSAVRMTHIPSGIVVSMQDERSQQENRARAMQILRSRVYDYYETQNQEKYDQNRKNAIGTGDRSERIRTYNYPQNRVTDHRIGLTLNKLDRIMNGELDEIIDALIVHDQAQKMESLNA
jgi:peptide chain release factor 1